MDSIRRFGKHVILSVVASWTLPRSAALLLIFAAAWTKAVLVALYYMHLR